MSSDASPVVEGFEGQTIESPSNIENKNKRSDEVREEKDLVTKMTSPRPESSNSKTSRRSSETSKRSKKSRSRSSSSDSSSSSSRETCKDKSCKRNRSSSSSSTSSSDSSSSSAKSTQKVDKDGNELEDGEILSDDIGFDEEKKKVASDNLMADGHEHGDGDVEAEGKVEETKDAGTGDNALFDEEDPDAFRGLDINNLIKEIHIDEQQVNDRLAAAEGHSSVTEFSLTRDGDGDIEDVEETNSKERGDMSDKRNVENGTNTDFKSTGDIADETVPEIMTSTSESAGNETQGEFLEKSTAPTEEYPTNDPIEEQDPGSVKPVSEEKTDIVVESTINVAVIETRGGKSPVLTAEGAFVNMPHNLKLNPDKSSVSQEQLGKAPDVPVDPFDKLMTSGTSRSFTSSITRKNSGNAAKHPIGNIESTEGQTTADPVMTLTSCKTILSVQSNEDVADKRKKENKGNDEGKTPRTVEIGDPSSSTTNSPVKSNEDLADKRIMEKKGNDGGTTPRTVEIGDPKKKTNSDPVPDVQKNKVIDNDDDASRSSRGDRRDADLSLVDFEEPLDQVENSNDESIIVEEEEEGGKDETSEEEEKIDGENVGSVKTALTPEDKKMMEFVVKVFDKLADVRNLPMDIKNDLVEAMSQIKQRVHFGPAFGACRACGKIQTIIQGDGDGGDGRKDSTEEKEEIDGENVGHGNEDETDGERHVSENATASWNAKDKSAVKRFGYIVYHELRHIISLNQRLTEANKIDYDGKNGAWRRGEESYRKDGRITPIALSEEEAKDKSRYTGIEKSLDSISFNVRICDEDIQVMHIIKGICVRVDDHEHFMKLLSDFIPKLIANADSDTKETRSPLYAARKKLHYFIRVMFWPGDSFLGFVDPLGSTNRRIFWQGVHQLAAFVYVRYAWNQTVERLKLKGRNMNWDDFKKPKTSQVTAKSEIECYRTGDVVFKLDKKKNVIFPKVAAKGTWGAQENDYFNSKARRLREAYVIDIADAYGVPSSWYYETWRHRGASFKLTKPPKTFHLPKRFFSPVYVDGDGWEKKVPRGIKRKMSQDEDDEDNDDDSVSSEPKSKKRRENSELDVELLEANMEIFEKLIEEIVGKNMEVVEERTFQIYKEEFKKRRKQEKEKKQRESV